MENWKLFYAFNDPMGALDSKIGITGHPAVRLGVYQNGYSRNSHIACFDTVYIGESIAVGNLEKAVKNKFDWDIERDGRGVSEWISGQTVEDISTKLINIIDGFKFKVQKVDANFLPLNMENLDEFLEHYNLTTR